jgi:hypothetical protein
MVAVVRAFAWVPLQKFLQHGLQEGGRDIFGANFWTDMIIPIDLHGAVPWWPGHPTWTEKFFDVESGTPPTDLAVISDLRQPNEAERVRNIGGVVVEMFRPDTDDGYRTGREHVTERRLPYELSNYEVMNDGTVEDLERAVRLLFEVHLKPWIMSGRGAHA